MLFRSVSQSRYQRYRNEKDVAFVIPTSTMDNNVLFRRHNAHCLALYNDLIANGVKKEDARFVLPEATCTELIVTGNLQAWLDFIRLRSIPAAQWEIREVAIGINNILAKECPNIFKEII